MIRAVLLDISSCLLSTDPHIQKEIADSLDALRDIGVMSIGFTNQQAGEALGRLNAAGVNADEVVTRADVGIAKGSPRWVEWVCARYDMQPPELIIVGAEKLAMVTASHAKVLFVNAGWGVRDVGYGIPLALPSLLPTFIAEFMNQPHPWYWVLDGSDAAGRRVEGRALVQGKGDYVEGLGGDLMDVLHKGRTIDIGPFDFLDFVLYHALGSLYGEGLVQQADLWTVYPGHAGGANDTIAGVLDLAAKLVRGGFLPDLLLRHAIAGDASLRRARGQLVQFEDQLSTVRLNAAHREKVDGASILIFDDFITEGHSFDWARNLLLEAGAARVVGVFVGVYGGVKGFRSPVDGTVLDPYANVNLTSADFSTRWLDGELDGEALTAFAGSYRRLGAQGRTTR